MLKKAIIMQKKFSRVQENNKRNKMRIVPIYSQVKINEKTVTF